MSHIVISTVKRRDFAEVAKQKAREVRRAVDSVIPPWKAPEINQRAQAEVHRHLCQGDVEGAQRALAEARAQMDEERRKH